MSGGLAAGAWSGPVHHAAVREALGRCTLVGPFHTVEETGSTQDLARGLAGEGAPSGTIVVADRQLAGRGRSGRRWDDDPRGGTLALTLLLDVDRVPVSVLPLVPHALGLAVRDACAPTVPGAEALRLKWPNDVVLREDLGEHARKVSGVLIERERVEVPAGARDVLLCGIGLDVDLRGGGEAPDRVCLATLAGVPPDRVLLLAALVRAMDASLTLLAEDPAALLERYRAVSDTVGRRVTIESPGPEVVTGVAVGVDEDGRLLVRGPGGTRAILSGTVRDAGGTP